MLFKGNFFYWYIKVGTLLFAFLVVFFISYTSDLDSCSEKANYVYLMSICPPALTSSWPGSWDALYFDHSVRWSHQWCLSSTGWCPSADWTIRLWEDCYCPGFVWRTGLPDSGVGQPYKHRAIQHEESGRSDSCLTSVPTHILKLLPH